MRKSGFAPKWTEKDTKIVAEFDPDAEGNSPKFDDPEDAIAWLHE